MSALPGSSLGRAVAGAVLAAGLVAGCSTGGHSSSPTTPVSAPATTAPATSSTTPGPQTGGLRTVLSPNGLNVRGAPSASAPVLGSAAQGAVLTVLGYSSGEGGWFKVKGATVTGWISAQPTLSAPGEFKTYSSSEFAAMYPADWSEATLGSATSPTTSAATQDTSTSQAPATASVAFRPAVGTGDVVVTSTGSVSQLPQGRPGYGRTSVTQVVVCGVTAGLVVFQRSSASATAPGTSVPQSLAYLAEVRFAVDAQHALGLYADMPDLGRPFDIFKAILASVTFSSPQCSG